jgi:hypothetical protein
MTLTFIGIIQIAIGLILILASPPRHVFVFMLVAGLFGGGAALFLPALGGSSIPPIQFACLLVYVRLLAPNGGTVGMVPEALRANRWLVLYTFYGTASALIAPRMFANSVNVVPLRFDDARGLFDTAPLVPSSQNITTTVYLVGTLAIALASYIVCRLRGGVNALISAAIAIGWLHIALGLVTAATQHTAIAFVFEMFRNGHYAQLNQSYESFVRIHGLFPEPSSFAEYGFAYFVLNTELWYRSIRPRATGSVAVALALILFFSTSSSAYVALAAYSAFFILRVALFPELAEGLRVRQFVVTAFALVVLTACAVLMIPAMLNQIWGMVLEMTVAKSGSTSGQQRLFWALQGWKLLDASYGLGVGPGSFRSSSLLMAIVGSTGVIGLVSFGLHLRFVFQPTLRSNFGRSTELTQTIGGAFATAALMSLIPSFIASPSPDLGSNFAFLSGAALALRSKFPSKNIADDARIDYTHSCVDPLLAARAVTSRTP